MLDELLGRAALKERVAELEAENEDLSAELDAEAERRADAQSARQDAEHEVNRLEDRIAQLEDHVDRLQDEETAIAYTGEETLRRSRVSAVLDRLESFETGPEAALTAAVPDEHSLPDELREGFGERSALVRRAAPCVAVTDDAGLLSAVLSTPVTPDPFATWADGFEFGRSWFEPTGTHTVALVRSDLFAMGEYDGRERTAFHGFDAELKSQHSKGGFSQARFERLRDEQIDTHVERCLAALEEREADRLFVVGERSILSAFSDVADVTQPVDATGEPEDALGDAFHEFWTVRLGLL